MIKSKVYRFFRRESIEIMIDIRPYDIKYREQVRGICYANSSDNAYYRDNRDVLLTLYCDYYIDVEPDNCFVAVNEEDIAIGYIISSDNYKYYKKNYKPYMKKLWKKSIKLYIDKLFAIIVEKKLSREYPAHLHIDIDSDYQRLGLGTRLLDALHKSLKEKGVIGIHLECGSDNVKAVNFYNKYGFKRLGAKGMVFGLNLKEWGITE